jgi:hypothetical protein
MIILQQAESYTSVAAAVGTCWPRHVGRASGYQDHPAAGYELYIRGCSSWYLLVSKLACTE